MLRYLELAVHLGSAETLGSILNIEEVGHFKQMASFQRKLFQLSETLLIKSDVAVRGTK